jgi:hypothetical protein
MGTQAVVEENRIYINAQKVCGYQEKEGGVQELLVVNQ